MSVLRLAAQSPTPSPTTSPTPSPTTPPTLSWNTLTVKIPVTMVGYASDPAHENNGAALYTIQGIAYTNGTGVVQSSNFVSPPGTIATPLQLLATYLHAAQTGDMATIRSLYVTEAQSNFDDQSVVSQLKTMLASLNTLELLLLYNDGTNTYMFVKETYQGQSPNVVPIPFQVVSGSYKLAVTDFQTSFYQNIVVALNTYPLNTLIVPNP